MIRREGKHSCFRRQEIVAVAQFQSVKYDVRRNIRSQLIGYQIRVIRCVIGEAGLIALYCSGQFQRTGDAAKLPAIRADLHCVRQIQFAQIKAEAHRRNADGHRFALDDDSVRILHGYRHLIVSRIPDGGDTVKPYTCPVIVIADRVCLIKLARQRQRVMCKSVISPAVGLDRDLPLLDRKNGNRHHALLTDLAQDLLHCRHVRPA